MANGCAHHHLGHLLLDRDLGGGDEGGGGLDGGGLAVADRLLLGMRIRIGAIAPALPAAGGAGGGEGGGGLGGGGLGGGDEGGGRRRRCQLACLGIVEWLEVMVG